MIEQATSSFPTFAFLRCLLNQMANPENQEENWEQYKVDDRPHAEEKP